MTPAEEVEVITGALEAGISRLEKTGDADGLFASVLRLGLEIVTGSSDPRAAIERLRDAKPWLAETEAEWAARIEGRWPSK